MCTLIDYETFLGMEFNYSALDTVVSGESVKDSLPILIERLGASRVFIVASNSVSQATDEFAEIKVRLDSKCVGVFDQVGAHTPREDVLRVLNKVQASEAAFEVCKLSTEILGGAGIMYEHPVEKYLRDAASFLHSDGTNQICSLRVTKALSGLDSAALYGF